jgi:hypothetical protein
VATVTAVNAFVLTKGGTMADFSETIRTLEQQRRELLEQVAAIDRAIAALSGADKPYPRPGVAPVRTPAQAPAKRAVKKRRFALSDEHKRKLFEGRKRAREARATRAEASDAGVPVVGGWSGDGPPRLVK